MMSKMEGIEEWELRMLYDDNMSQQEIADYYGVSKVTIWNRMKEYEIETRACVTSHLVSSIQEIDLRRMYDIEGMTIKEIAASYGVSVATIWTRMKFYNIERRSISEACRKYSINEDFFKTWTPESSWLYGWFLGDGWEAQDKVLGFNLSRVDREVLEKFKDVLDSEHPIGDPDVWNEEYQKYIKMSRIDFCSKKLIDVLTGISYLDVPSCFLSCFIRGFFEAEGCVSWHKLDNLNGGIITSNFVQSDYDILDFIHWCLKDNGVVNGGSMHLYGKSWTLVFSKYDSISLYHYMYDNCGNMFLKRKKEKFEELILRGGL